RPYWLKRASRRWLELKGFPVGQVYTYSGAFPATDTTAVDYKSGVLSAAIERGADFVHAFGNADTDIAAYAAVGIPVADTYVIGESAGLGGTVVLGQYSDLYGSLVPAPPSTPRIVFVIVDGLRPDVFRYYIDEIAGPDSAFRAIFEKKVDVKNSATCFPSMTFPGHAMLATGVSSGKNGIVGNKFFDRKTGTPYALSGGETMELSQAFSVYRGEGLANSLLETQTFYEQMSASGHYGVVANHMYFKGAEYLYPSMTEMLTFIIDVRAYDQSVTDSLLERLDGSDIPDVMTLYYGGLDTEAHELGMVGAMRPENSQVQYLAEVLDGEMNLLRNRFEALGILDEVSFVLVSDHGMVDLVGDEAHAINLDRAVNVIESSPYEDVYNQIAFEGDFDSHAGLNGGGFFITLRNRATNSWQDAPRFEEDLMPVLGAVQKQRWDGELVGAVEDVLGRKSLDSPYEVYRPTQVQISFEKIHVWDDNNSNGPGLFTFAVGANGKKPITLGPVLAESGDSLNVNQTMQVDLLGKMELSLIVSCDKGMGTGESLIFEKSSLPTGSWLLTSSTGSYSLELSVEEVATSTSSYPALPFWGNICPLEVLNPIYVDGPQRVSALTHSSRMGDLMVLIRFGDGFYAAQEEHSGHGSMYPGDSIQAFFIGGGVVSQSSDIEGKSGADIPATICSMLGIELRDAEGVSRFPLSGN
ncbi:MAG: alkaline phosphatase family protein, partial [Planctomycetota bacterium]|nr:alkaline phosphatase family protein [Planctomycetota bacterium]